MTHRGIVSAVYSLFDPLGFIAPYPMKAKLLLQTLSGKRLGWNDTLEETNKEQWKRWLDDLPKLHQIQVDRSFKPKGFGEVKEVELHLFSDTSQLSRICNRCIPPFERCDQLSSQCICDGKSKLGSHM